MRGVSRDVQEPLRFNVARVSGGEATPGQDSGGPQSNKDGKEADGRDHDSVALQDDVWSAES
jgi:hypothetical protein